jgi:hypothetical protein
MSRGTNDAWDAQLETCVIPHDFAVETVDLSALPKIAEERPVARYAPVVKTRVQARPRRNSQRPTQPSLRLVNMPCDVAPQEIRQPSSRLVKSLSLALLLTSLLLAVIFFEGPWTPRLETWGVRAPVVEAARVVAFWLDRAIDGGRESASALWTWLQAQAL